MISVMQATYRYTLQAARRQRPSSTNAKLCRPLIEGSTIQHDKDSTYLLNLCECIRAVSISQQRVIPGRWPYDTPATQRARQVGSRRHEARLTNLGEGSFCSSRSPAWSSNAPAIDILSGRAFVETVRCTNIGIWRCLCASARGRDKEISSESVPRTGVSR